MSFSYAHAENYVVTILDGTSQQSSGLKFYPETLPFRGDDTITWKNEDSVVHSITSGISTHPEYSGVFFKTGKIQPGQSGTVKIDVKENFAFYYFCEMHPWLSGKLVVETAPEARPETTDPIVAEKAYTKPDIPISGQVHYDFRKTPYDVLVYQDSDNLVSVKHGSFDDNGSYTNTISSLSPGRYTLKVVYGLPTQVGIINTEIMTQNEIIPKWIKMEAKWWADGAISDSEFIKAIEYLAKEKVIKIQKSQSVQQEKTVPAWLKQSAGWWASEQISDAEFAKSLQYLSDAGIIQI